MKYGRLLIVLAATLLLFGCQTLLTEQGKMVDPEKRIALQDRMEQESWNTRDLSLAYRAIRHGSTLELSGKISFARYLINNYITVRSFHMDIVFLDDSGRVLWMTGLTSIPEQAFTDPISFNTVLNLPPGATSFAFSYQGETGSSGDDEGMSRYLIQEFPMH